jgi:hypothetical protein
MNQVQADELLGEVLLAIEEEANLLSSSDTQIDRLSSLVEELWQELPERNRRNFLLSRTVAAALAPTLGRGRVDEFRKRVKKIFRGD